MKLIEIYGKLGRLKGLGIIFVLLAAGLIMILFSSGTGTKKEEETDVIFDFTEYEKNLEKRLEEKINRIKGVSGTDVIVLLDSSYSTDYITDKSGKTVISDKSALAAAEIAPRVRGAAVICEGGDDPIIQREIISMLCALLDLSTNKIYVGGK